MHLFAYCINAVSLVEIRPISLKKPLLKDFRHCYFELFVIGAKILTKIICKNQEKLFFYKFKISSENREILLRKIQLRNFRKVGFLTRFCFVPKVQKSWLFNIHV
jgi:hypothetical protein